MSGSVYYPEGEKFADEVIEECLAFPHGENDDYVDSTTQAMLRYRQGYYVSVYSDEEQIEKYKEKKYILLGEHMSKFKKRLKRSN